MGTQRQFQTLFHTPTLKYRRFIPFLLTTEEDRQGFGYLRRWKQHRDGWVQRDRERERERDTESDSAAIEEVDPHGCNDNKSPNKHK
jgi:hypothetical protein